jgi:hypothetical protein
LFGEQAEAERVLAVAAFPDARRHHAVVVEIEAGRDAGVGRRDQGVGIIDRRRRGAEAEQMSSPSALRLSDALKVATRI